jgi:hypothetical protein
MLEVHHLFFVELGERGHSNLFEALLGVALGKTES